MNAQKIRCFAALGAFALASAAFSQVSKPLNVSIRLGTFNPSADMARDEGKSWFAIGAETRIKNLGVSSTNRGQSSYLTVSVDSYGKGDFHSTPVLLNYVSRSNELYFTGGAGVAFVKEPSDSGNTRVGYQFGAGWDFQQSKTPLFVEVKWFGTSNNDHLNGFGLFVGIRL